MTDKQPLPKVELNRTVIDFGQDCMDPVAKMIITEAMSYAVETAEKRLTSIGKIFSTAGSSGIKVLAVVAEIKNQVAGFPVCAVGKEPLAKSFTPAPPPPQPPKELGKMSRKDIEDTVKRAAEQKKGKKAAKSERRTQPERWQEVEVVDEKGNIKKYETPGAAAIELGIVSEGAKNMVHAFRRAGFEVSGNGEPKKGVGRFIIKATGKPIPSEHQLLLKPVKQSSVVEAKDEKKTKLLAVKIKDKLDHYEVVDDDNIVRGKLTVEQGTKLLADGAAVIA